MEARAQARLLGILGVVLASLLSLAPRVVRAAVANDPRAILPLIVNGVEKGERLVIIRDGDVLVRVVDLEQAGIQPIAGRRELIRDEWYVALSSLRPDVSGALDDRALTLRITVDPRLLNTTVIDVLPPRPSGISYDWNPAVFLNYALNWQDLDRPDPFGFAETGVSLGRGFLYSSASRTFDGTLARGLTNVTFDDPDELRRWTFGDTLAASSTLGGGLFLGGFSLWRNFALDPYFIRYPTPGLSGAALTPSTVDVFVNGVFMGRKDVPPGPFEIRDVPATVGSGTTTFVVRDAFGREQAVVSPYYFGSGALAPGLHEYSYNVGFERTGLTSGIGEYGDAVFLGRHRYGLTDWCTIGGRLEASHALASGGPSVTFQTPLGELNFEGASSRDASHWGGAGLASYRYIARRFGVGLFARALSPHYAHLTLEERVDRPRLEVSASIGSQLSTRLSANLIYTAAEWRDRGFVNRLGVLANLRISDRISGFLSVTPQIPGSAAAPVTSEPETVVFMGINFFFNGSGTATVFHEQKGARGVTGLEVQKPLPVGTGFGYRARGQVGDDAAERLGGVLQYQGPWGLYEVGYEHADGGDSARALVAGGITAVGGRVYATRPVNDSFAIIRVPGVEGVRGYVENQEVGRTDSSGDLFVPSLLPYYGNKLRIEDKDLPLDYSVGARERVVAPPVRGGAVVSFPVQRVQAFTGTVAVDTPRGAVIPAFGDLTVTAGDVTVTSPIGKGGEFYLQNLPPGRHRAVIAHGDVGCEFFLNVPDVPEPFVSLGAQRCAGDAR
ncbi:MAG: fimbria/pilus outer membrane usher protein [Candidatus Binatia bacterium]